MNSKRNEKILEIISKVTDSEKEVLEVMWDEGREMTYAQIRASLENRQSWESSTIKTLLRRLVNKGAASIDKREVYYYTPAFSQDVYHSELTQTFLERVFAGNSSRLIASLLDNNSYTQDELDKMRAMFTVKDDEDE